MNTSSCGFRVWKPIGNNLTHCDEDVFPMWGAVEPSKKEQTSIEILGELVEGYQRSILTRYHWKALGPNKVICQVCKGFVREWWVISIRTLWYFIVFFEAYCFVKSTTTWRTLRKHIKTYPTQISPNELTNHFVMFKKSFTIELLVAGVVMFDFKPASNNFC